MVAVEALDLEVVDLDLAVVVAVSNENALVVDLEDGFVDLEVDGGFVGFLIWMGCRKGVRIYTRY